MLKRRILIAALMLLAPALWAVSFATASTPSDAAQAPQATIDAVYGRVLANGQPAPNVNVSLQLTAGSVESTVVTATTTITGYYEFSNPPALQSDEWYNVVFGPQNDPAYLNKWIGPKIDEYETGTVFGGDLEVADVALIAPPDNASVSFPVTFQWQPRPVETESYYVGFLDPDTDLIWPSNPVGHNGSLTLNSLADVPGLQTGKQYAWLILIDYVDPDHNYNSSAGYSLARRNVTFTGSGTTPTPTATGTTTPPSGTPTATATAVSETATPTATATTAPPADTPTPTATPTIVPTIATPTATATTAPPSDTPTATATATGTAAPPTNTPTATATATGTAAPPTNTPTATPTTTGTPWTPSHWVYLPLLARASTLMP